MLQMVEERHKRTDSKYGVWVRVRGLCVCVCVCQYQMGKR